MVDKPRSVAVIGAGSAGMAAASILSDAGIAVDVIEKEKRIGGYAARWACMATDGCNYCSACLSAETSLGACKGGAIDFHLGNEVAEVSKVEGAFEIKLTGDGAGSVRADAVLIAAGMRPYDPTENTTLGYGRIEGVASTVDLDDIIAEDRLDGWLPEGSDEPEIAFVQCVGSRDREAGRDYCSQVCCKIAARMAAKILYVRPKVKITVFNIDFQTTGKQFRSFMNDLSQKVDFIQGVPNDLRVEEGGLITATYEDSATGSPQNATFDQVVLAVGILPSLGLSDLAAQFGGSTDRWGFLGGEGAELPEGVFSIGTANGPSDILSARADAVAAASKILERFDDSDARKKQTIAILGAGKVGMAAARRAAEGGYKAMLIDEGDISEPEHENIECVASADLRRIEGGVGEYQLHFTVDGERRSFDSDAVVISTGYLREAVGLSKSVMESGRVSFLGEFLRSMEEGTEQPKRLVFWLDRNGPEWKGNVRRSLRAALSLAKQKIEVAVLMEKMLVAGAAEQGIYDKARAAGVRFFRLDPATETEVSVLADALELRLNDMTLHDLRLKLETDHIVLPERVYANPKNEELGRLLGQRLDSEGFLQPANVRHRLIGSSRRGMFFIGGCHDEIDDFDMSFELDVLIGELDRLFICKVEPEERVTIDSRACIRCTTCMRICPHGAIRLLDDDRPEIIDAACVVCGTCASACPALAIVHSKPAIIDLQAMDCKDATVVFACERSASIAADEALKKGLADIGDLRIVPVGCAGSVGMEDMIKPLAMGARRVVVSGCHEGNCRSISGGSIAANRVERALMGLGDKDKISFVPLAANESYRFAKLMLEWSGSVKEDSNA